MNTENKKETCKGCPYIQESNAGLNHCQIWNRIVSPSVTDACLYKGYDKKDKKGGRK